MEAFVKILLVCQYAKVIHWMRRNHATKGQLQECERDMVWDLDHGIVNAFDHFSWYPSVCPDCDGPCSTDHGPGVAL